MLKVCDLPWRQLAGPSGWLEMATGAGHADKCTRIADANKGCNAGGSWLRCHESRASGSAPHACRLGEGGRGVARTSTAPPWLVGAPICTATRRRLVRATLSTAARPDKSLSPPRSRAGSGPGAPDARVAVSGQGSLTRRDPLLAGASHSSCRVVALPLLPPRFQRGAAAREDV